MNCRDARLLLDDLVDGAIGETSRHALELHLRGCVACRASEAQLRNLLAAVGALPRRIEPARELWSGIAARITAGNVVTGAFAERGRRRIPLGAAAAAAALLIALTSIVTAVLLRGGHASREGLASDGGARGTVAASLQLSQARSTCEAARRQLLTAFEARRASLSPATLKVVDDNLRIIDRAVRDMEDALARDPGNQELPSLLVTAYRQEIDMLQRAAGIPARG